MKFKVYTVSFLLLVLAGVVALPSRAVAFPRPLTHIQARHAAALLLYSATSAVPTARIVVLQNAVSATGNGATIDLTGMGACGIQVAGTFTATVTFEATIDGVNWKSIGVTPAPGTSSPVTSTTAEGIWFVPTAGVKKLRAPVTWTSGTSVTVTALATSVGNAMGATSSGGVASGVTIADGADTDQGSIANAAVVGDNSGTQSAKLRGVNTTLGTSADAAVTGDNAGTVEAHLRGLLKDFVTQLPAALGQTTMAASLPVAIASNQSALTVQGSVAAGAAVGGNPLPIGMSDGTNAQRFLAAIALGDGVNGNNQLPVVEYGWNGTTYDRMQLDASKFLKVAQQGNITAVGVAAHGASVSGNPNLVGAEAVNTQRAVVTNGQVSRLTTDLAGRLITIPYAGTEDSLQGYATATGTSNTQLIAAQAGSLRIYVTSVIVDNDSATNSEVDIKDGTTIIATLPAPATSGAAHPFPVPLKGTAATALNFASVTAVTTMKVTVVGFRGY